MCKNKHPGGRHYARTLQISTDSSYSRRHRYLDVFPLDLDVEETGSNHSCAHHCEKDCNSLDEVRPIIFDTTIRLATTSATNVTIFSFHRLNLLFEIQRSHNWVTRYYRMNGLLHEPYRLRNTIPSRNRMNNFKKINSVGISCKKHG